MVCSSEFWSTHGVARYCAILARYDEREIDANMACKYLADLLTDDHPFDEEQRRLIETAQLLTHELSEGASIGGHEFAELLASR
jgi:hypothetical protein